jgi:hypothetical protein
MAKQVSSRNTKAQILEAYGQLYDEHERLQAEHTRLLKEKQALEKTAATPPTAPAVPDKPVEAVKQPGTVDAILESLAALRAGFGSAISELSTQLTAEATKLQELQSKMTDQAEELAELYGLAVTESTMDDLVGEYRRKVESFEQEARARRETFEQDLARRREEWKQEQEEHARAVKERDERLKKERQRENQEYEYNLEMQRRLEAEQYEQEAKKQRRELEALVEAREKEWAARELALTIQENEYQDLKTKVESFPDELASAVKLAQKEGRELAFRQAKITDDLLAKQEEGDRRVAELKIASLEQTIGEQAAQIEALSAQLGAVVKQSQALAIKAIEGTSHETSFQSIREIALEQAKRPPKGE